jgi:colanic acid biosynthesis glycosyl transferase WcaI
MKFILNSLNYSPELTGIGKYNGEMGPELVERGLTVTAIVAPPYYPEWKIHQGFKSYWFEQQTIAGVKVTRCPLYVPNKVTAVKRILHLASFAFTSGLALISRLFKKPNVVFLVQPTLFCAPAVLLLCKLTGAKSVMHVQDYEIDAMFGLGMMNDGKVARLVKSIERWLMQRFDAVSTISFSMIENAVAKGVNRNKIIYFPNWSDTNFVTPETKGDLLKKQWGFAESDKIILYAGNIGKKQGLEIVIEAAKHFENVIDLKFVIVGAGAHVEVLKALATDLKLSNLFFLPLQPWERVPEMLALADIHLVVQKKGAADAVLPSKLTNILSAGGHTLVTAEPDTELGKLAERFSGIFHCVEPDNTEAFITGLTLLLNSNLATHNQIARNYAEEYLAKDKILDKFVDDLKQLVG